MKNCTAQKTPQNINDTTNIFTSTSNSIAIYTVLSILVQMRHQVGLGAMLDYLNEYIETIEQNNPKIKMAVRYAIKLMNVRKIYEDAKKHKTK